MYGYIYKTTDLQTNLIYIGQKKSNKFLGKKYLGSGKVIRELLNTGESESRFLVEMIDTADTAEELNEKEIYWISKYNSRNPEIGYNKALGGAVNIGFKQTDLQKSIVSNYMKNRIISEDTKSKMSESAKCRTLNRITNGNYIWMHKNQEEIMVPPNEVGIYETKGYVIGRVEKTESEKQSLKDKYNNSTYIIKDNKCILISNNELDEYLSKGWKIGRLCYTKNRGNNISKSKSGTVKIIHLITHKVKYIKPELLEQYKKEGFILNEEYKKITQ